jgi:hypothetical protein
MATSKKSTGKKSNGQQSSQAATPVNRLAKQANAKARKTRDTCGHGYEQPLANYDPITQSWKMCQVISLSGEPKLLERLPKSGMTRNGVLYQQPDWVPIISENESSSWPTPTAVTRPMEGNVRKFRALIDAGQMTEAEANAILGKSVYEAQGKVPASWPTPTASDHIERKSTQQTPNSRHSLNLPDAVKRWPTPTTQEIEHPQAIWTVNNRRISKSGTTDSMNLADAVKTISPNGGKLNPTWVEWLMGFPTGWTDLKD